MLALLSTSQNRDQAPKRFGTSKDPLVFKKEEFLTKRSLAVKFQISTNQVEEIMEKMQKRKEKIFVNGHATPAIIHYDPRTPRVHPLALDIFQQYLDKEKAKQ